MATPGPRKPVAICPHCRRLVEALPLTYRQWEVARRLIGGESTRQIAHDLFMSHKTVESHRHRILETLDVPNIPQLIRWAHDQGLLELLGWGKA